MTQARVIIDARASSRLTLIAVLIVVCSRLFGRDV
jgi:hypothetical protein